jgi:hypothetical protein
VSGCKLLKINDIAGRGRGFCPDLSGRTTHPNGVNRSPLKNAESFIFLGRNFGISWQVTKGVEGQWVMEMVSG